MTVKKIKISNGKKKKLITRTAGQAHFNSRETGKVGRNKRSDKAVAKSDEKNVRRQLPYS